MMEFSSGALPFLIHARELYHRCYVKNDAGKKYDPYNPEQLTTTQIRLPHLTQERCVGFDFAGTDEDEQEEHSTRCRHHDLLADNSAPEDGYSIRRNRPRRSLHCSMNRFSL
jgi:hypothetical protein